MLADHRKLTVKSAIVLGVSRLGPEIWTTVLRRHDWHAVYMKQSNL